MVVASARRMYAERKALVWTVVVLAPLVVVGVGVMVAPDVFWDHFLWEDLYGPLWADAHQCGSTSACPTPAPNPHGVLAKEGYTVTSELVYGAVLAASLYGIYAGLLRRFHVRMDGAWVAALAPYILLGPTARTLEDMNVFIGQDGQPGVFAYLFISPIIYMHIAVYTVAFLAVGVLVERAQPRVASARLVALVAAIALAETLGYTFIVTAYRSGFTAVAPWWVFAIAAALGVAFFAWRASKGRANVNATLFSLGLPLISAPAWLIGVWLAGHTWRVESFNGILYVGAGATILAFAVGITAIVAAIAFVLSRGSKGLAGAALYVNGLNLALVFGHMVDATATWFALLDPFKFGLPKYSEKHPFSDFLLQIGAGTPFHGLGFPIAKLVMILAVIWLLDREFKEESSQDRELVGLIKMAILVLGFAPGTRDLLRVSLGV